MKIELVSEKDNPLLERKEVVVKVSDYGATPSRTDLLEELPKILKGANKEGVYIEKVDQHYGRKQTLVMAHVYASRESLEKHIHKKLLRTSGKKKAAAA
jgi:small subunit ribosomal protein S24e